MANKKLAILVPAFNEEKTIELVISRLSDLEAQLRDLGISSSIIVVNDGSTDNTEDLARSTKKVILISHLQNRGLGAAVRTGLAEAKKMDADIAIKFDADLQHDPKDILSLIEPILADRADLVYGERFTLMDYKMPFVRRIGNKVFSNLMAYLTRWPIQDSQPGIFAVGSTYLDVFDIPGDYNYTQQILLDGYLKGMRFEQKSVFFHKRKSGKSFVSFAYPFKVIPQMILVLCVSRPLSFFFPIGSASFLLGIGVLVYQMMQWVIGGSIKPVTNVNFVLGTLLFGLQMVFFGLLAQLIVITRKR